MSNIKVAIRVRPLIQREVQNNSPTYWDVKDSTRLCLNQSPHTSFLFDRVFDTNEDNQTVYQDLCAPLVEAAMDGFNGTIFVYGQTSSGKTYTMNGETGIIRNAVQDIFTAIDNMPERKFLIRVSYMEIYNEMLSDLTVPVNKNLKIKEDADGLITVDGLSEIEIKSSADVFQVLKVGERYRNIGETRMNEKSSRSHVIFRMIVESRMCNSDMDDDDVCVAHLNLVDLAGSERASASGASGTRFKEGIHINKSLFTLGTVIRQLSEGDRQHVSYRDSKLTRILQNSLGGNAHTVIICTVSPAFNEHTASTLMFADRAKHIKNKPIINVVSSDRALLKRYDCEIKKLTEQLEAVQKQNANPEVLRKELQATNKQNEDLKIQIKALKEKFLVSQFKTHHLPLPVISKSSRRETWCFGRANRLLLEPETSVSFLKPLPVLKEDDSSPCVTESPDSRPRRSSSLSDVSEVFLSPEDKISCSTQTQAAHNNEVKLKKQLEDMARKLCSERLQKEKIEKELKEQLEFIKLEKEYSQDNAASEAELAVEKETVSIRENARSQSLKEQESLLETLRSKATKQCEELQLVNQVDWLLKVDVEQGVQVQGLSDDQIRSPMPHETVVLVECGVQCEVEQELSKPILVDKHIQANMVENVVESTVIEPIGSDVSEVIPVVKLSLTELKQQVMDLKSFIQNSYQHISDLHIDFTDVIHSSNVEHSNDERQLMGNAVWEDCENSVQELRSVVQAMVNNQAVWVHKYTELKSTNFEMGEQVRAAKIELVKWQNETKDVLEEFLDYKRAQKLEKDRLREIVESHALKISEYRTKNEEFCLAVKQLSEQNSLQLHEMKANENSYLESIKELMEKHKKAIINLKGETDKRWKVELSRKMEVMAEEYRLRIQEYEEAMLKLRDFVVENVQKVKSALPQNLNVVVAECNGLTCKTNETKMSNLQVQKIAELEKTLKRITNELEWNKSEYMRQISFMKKDSEDLKLSNTQLCKQAEIDEQVKWELERVLQQNARLTSEMERMNGLKPVRATPIVVSKSTATNDDLPTPTCADPKHLSNQAATSVGLQNKDQNSACKEEIAAVNTEMALENKKLQRKVQSLENEKEVLLDKISSYKSELRRIQATPSVPSGADEPSEEKGVPVNQLAAIDALYTALRPRRKYLASKTNSVVQVNKKPYAREEKENNQVPEANSTLKSELNTLRSSVGYQMRGQLPTSKTAASHDECKQQ